MLGIADKKYPLAKGGVFWTVQGEGALLGTPMHFVRLAGCSVGCAECDTDYVLHEKLTATEIGARVDALPRCRWSWVTGGEPADYELWPLLEVLRLRGKVALVTSGHKILSAPTSIIDFLSVSPHHPKKWEIRSGSQLNIVPGLNGFWIDDFANEYGVRDFPDNFQHRYVTPLHGSERSFRECVDWVKENQGWRLGVQAHKVWGMP